MSDRSEEYERLSRAFAARTSSQKAEDCPDPEVLFEAASGSLPLDQRMKIVDHLARCAECTEAWRLAMELNRGTAPRSGATRLQRFAFAASTVLAVGVVTYLALPLRDETPRYRDAAEALTPTSEVSGSLPRDRFLLKWSPGPEGSTYTVRLSTADLSALLVQQAVAEPELLVPASVLSSVRSGDQLFWQVELRLPDGRQIPSETLIVTLQ